MLLHMPRAYRRCWALTRLGQTSRMDDDRAPICPACGVTMVAAELSARAVRDTDWVCLECEETGDTDESD